MLQTTIKTRLLLSYLQMMPNFTPIDNFKNVETMQNCLDSVLQWAEVWQLTLSVAKCKILVLGNVKFSNVYNLVAYLFLMIIIILIVVLLWKINLHLTTIFAHFAKSVGALPKILQAP